MTNCPKDNLHNIIIFKNKTANYDKDNIKSIAIDKVIELGEKSKCVHLHALISIAQYTPIHLNYNYINEFVKEKMGLSNTYFNSKLWLNNKLTLLDYITKSAKK